jgi:hypothetical protein
MAVLRQAVRWWMAAHRRAARSLAAGGHRGEGVVSLAFCAALDLLVLVVGLFVAAMLVSPVLGI